jgi:putative copper export protein
LIVESLVAGLQSFAETSHILDSALGRALVYLSMAILLGTRLWRDGLAVMVATRHLRLAALLSGAAGCLLLVYATLAQLSPNPDAMSLSPISWPDFQAFMFHTSVGIGWLVFLAGLSISVVLIEHKASWLGILAMLLSVSANSHAGEYGLLSLTYATDLLHLSLALLWSGGVLVLVVLRLGKTSIADSKQLKRFSRLALPLFLLILLSGMARLMIQYGHDQGFAVLYITMLALKLMAVAGVAWSAYGLRQQLKRTNIDDGHYDNRLSMEIFFIAILIFATAIFTQLPTR